MKFEGTASSTTVDREGEQMTTRALEALARGGRVELRDGHRGEKIGVVEECCREGERLVVRGTLEESSPRARELWQKLQAGLRLALSVGGRKRVVRRYSPVAGRRVRMIEEASLEHVAVVRPQDARNEETGIVAREEGEVVRRATRDAREPRDAPALPSEPPLPHRESARGAGEGAGGEAPSPPPHPTSPLATPGRSRSLPGQKSGRTQTARPKSAPHKNDELWKGVL